MSKSDELDARAKLRSSRTKHRSTNRESEHDENFEPTSVLDDIWSTPYGTDTQALSQLELRLYKQKRKIYEVQRLLAQTVESLSILLGLLHSTLEEL